MSLQLIIRLSIMLIVAAIYLYVLCVVALNVWEVKIANRYQAGIFLVAVVLPPAGYWWYRRAKKKYGSNRGKGKKK
jgi:hypothetical protein